MQRIHSGASSITILLCTLLAASLLQPGSKAAASRAYPQGCARESPSYYDYDSLPLPPPNLPSRSHDDFALLRRLGAGKFSDVFEAVDVGIQTNDQVGDAAGDIDSDEIVIDPTALCVIKVRFYYIPYSYYSKICIC